MHIAKLRRLEHRVSRSDGVVLLKTDNVIDMGLIQRSRAATVKSDVLRYVMMVGS